MEKISQLERIQRIAQAILAKNELLAADLTQDFFREASRTPIRAIPRPPLEDERQLALCASLLELFAERLGQQPPSWTAEVAPLPAPLFLVEWPRMKRLRDMCERESPEPLRKRNLFAPSTYLEFV
jgi:hypothetical protein